MLIVIDVCVILSLEELSYYVFINFVMPLEGIMKYYFYILICLSKSIVDEDVFLNICCIKEKP